MNTDEDDAPERHYQPKKDSQLPTGYAIAMSKDTYRSLDAKGLAVPAKLIDDLNADAARRKAALELEATKTDAALDDCEKSSGPAAPAPAPVPAPAPALGWGTKPPKKPEWFVDPAPFDKGWRKPRGTDWIRIWNPAGLRAHIEAGNAATGSADRDARDRDAAVFRKMLADGPWRRCARPADPQALLSALAEECPNMVEAIEFVGEHVALAEVARSPQRLPPMLLIGPPGVGKTHFATRLAELLKTQMRLIDFTSQQTNSALHGNDRHWANTRPGILFDLVVLERCANPVVVLDELDKAARDGGGSRRYDPLAPLHLALEPSTAQRTRDLSMDLEFDASCVTYIATANSLQGLPDSLLSRMKLILCEPPGPQDALRTCHAVVRRVMATSAGRSFEGLDREVVLSLAEHTPRSIVSLLTSAMGRAAAAGRRRVELRDLPSGRSARGLLH